MSRVSGVQMQDSRLAIMRAQFVRRGVVLPSVKTGVNRCRYANSEVPQSRKARSSRFPVHCVGATGEGSINLLDRAERRFSRATLNHVYSTYCEKRRVVQTTSDFDFKSVRSRDILLEADASRPFALAIRRSEVFR